MNIYINLRGGQKIRWQFPDALAAQRFVEQATDEDWGLPPQSLWIELNRDNKFNFESHRIRRDAIDAITW